MTLTAETLERSLNNLAEEASRNDDNWPTGEWTRRVKQLLVQLADNNYTVYASEVTENGEWMYDVVWIDLVEGRIRAIPLVAECEWGWRPEVSDDFQKLLISRAEVRVMIFCANSREAASSLVEELKQQIEYFRPRRVGDTYLLSSHVSTESPPFSVEGVRFEKKLLTIKLEPSPEVGRR